VHLLWHKSLRNWHSTANIFPSIGIFLSCGNSYHISSHSATIEPTVTKGWDIVRNTFFVSEMHLVWSRFIRNSRRFAKMVSFKVIIFKIERISHYSMPHWGIYAHQITSEHSDSTPKRFYALCLTLVPQVLRSVNKTSVLGTHLSLLDANWDWAWIFRSQPNRDEFEQPLNSWAETETSLDIPRRERAL
jgi:hypothetical protein